jgi:hypothetical protein
MTEFDFDANFQGILNDNFGDISPLNWKKWLELTSPQEFEEACLKNSGLDSVSDLFDKLKRVKTQSRHFSLNLENFLKNYDKSFIPTVCHTSGTTNSKLSALKWFFMSKEVVKRNWAPGMQAIFESSGLTNEKSVVIFVPSRIKHDGLQTYNGQDYISLYSSEFSQRIMLSIIKPHSYLFYEYKNAKSLEVIAKMLQLEDIAVISAPALTILGWADRGKLKAGISASLQKVPEDPDPILQELIAIIKKKGLEEASGIIQERLSKKLSGATIVFSISSLSEDNWNLIRNFMNWEKGKEKFTNLYVISEIGPFAASILKKDYINTHFNDMFVFPLSMAALEIKSKVHPISHITSGYGKLYVSRMGEEDPLINIDLGDVISVLDNTKGLPHIEGKILRSSFQLQYPIKLSNKIKTPHSYDLFAGDYFTFNGFDIKEPRKLLFFLQENCELNTDSMLLISQNDKKEKYRLILPYSSSCDNAEFIKDKITVSKEMVEFHQLFEDNTIIIELIDDQPIDFLETRKSKLMKVRSGETPKGILKKWPLYVIQ